MPTSATKLHSHRSLVGVLGWPPWFLLLAMGLPYYGGLPLEIGCSLRCTHKAFIKFGMAWSTINSLAVNKVWQTFR